MSVKRQATTDLNHDNWDKDDPEEHEDMGSFKVASKDVLEKRVIRTAKRRSLASGDEPKKNVFSGFGGFNKTQPSSFDFLSKLTNGSKTTNGTEASKINTSSSSFFSSTPMSSNPSAVMFNTPATSASVSKPIFGVQSSQSSLFGGSITTTAEQSLCTTSKSDSKIIDTPFKIQNSLISTDNSPTESTLKPPHISTDSPSNQKPGLFSANFSNNNNQSVFASIAKTSSPFQIETKMCNAKTTFESSTLQKKQENGDDKKQIYYSKLKGLNESVSDWIKKHVEETPLCILTPIFKDYEKYLKEIREEFHGAEETNKIFIESTEIKSTSETPNTTTSLFTAGSKGNSLLPKDTSESSVFSNKIMSPASEGKSSGFSLGIKTPAPTTTSSGSSGFSFGVNTSTATTSSPFSLTTNTTSTNGAAPFSFGIGKPFSFSPNVQKPSEQTTEPKEEEDEPPKVEFTPIVEENSVFDKKCKIFVKKDGNFVDKGVGTLYIKKVEENGKHQLLARANTNLGNILLNLILTSSIPMQRLGKNNVMLVCIPTPDAKPPPTPILIRVKSSEEADNLLETLNKYKA